MGVDVLVPAMFVSLVVALLAGFPVAFSIAAVAAVFGIVGLVTGHFEPAWLLAMRFRIEGFFRNENLLSIPLFLFMGMLLERTHIAEDMLLALDRLMGGVRGGASFGSLRAYRPSLQNRGPHLSPLRPRTMRDASCPTT